MCMSGGRGANVELPMNEAALFGEDQARYLLEINDDAWQELQAAQSDAIKIAKKIGVVGGDALQINGTNIAKISDFQKSRISSQIILIGPKTSYEKIVGGGGGV